MIAFLRVWRVLGTIGGLFYIVIGFVAGVMGDRFSLGLYAVISGLYFFGAGKAHSAVKRRTRPGPRR